MNFKKALTPKEVEEIKPGFFIQKKGNFYRQIKPLVWEGKWRLKGQIKWGNVFVIILILALFFSGAKYVRFYEEVNSDPVAFCKNVSFMIDWENFGVINENTDSIQFDIEETPTTYG